MVLWIAALLIGVYLLNRHQSRQPNLDSRHHQVHKNGKSSPPSDRNIRAHEFNRRSEIIFTKHARCRMGCRQIDETEIREILLHGTINYRKSDPDSQPDPKYALEGVTRDGQQVRIIFADSDRGMVVVTVIDMQKEWNCNCK